MCFCLLFCFSLCDFSIVWFDCFLFACVVSVLDFVYDVGYFAFAVAGVFDLIACSLLATLFKLVVFAFVLLWFGCL